MRHTHTHTQSAVYIFLPKTILPRQQWELSMGFVSHSYNNWKMYPVISVPVSFSYSQPFTESTNRVTSRSKKSSSLKRGVNVVLWIFALAALICFVFALYNSERRIGGDWLCHALVRVRHLPHACFSNVIVLPPNSLVLVSVWVLFWIATICLIPINRLSGSNNRTAGEVFLIISIGQFRPRGVFFTRSV